MQLVGVDGGPLELKCINWSGFNTGQTMLKGVLTGGETAQDYGQDVYRLQVWYLRPLPLAFRIFSLHMLTSHPCRLLAYSMALEEQQVRGLNMHCRAHARP